MYPCDFSADFENNKSSNAKRAQLRHCPQEASCDIYCTRLCPDRCFCQTMPHRLSRDVRWYDKNLSVFHSHYTSDCYLHTTRSNDGRRTKRFSLRPVAAFPGRPALPVQTAPLILSP